MGDGPVLMGILRLLRVRERGEETLRQNILGCDGHIWRTETSATKQEQDDADEYKC